MNQCAFKHSARNLPLNDSMALSSMASASSFFSLAFSLSSPFKRLASETSSPPYLAFQFFPLDRLAIAPDGKQSCCVIPLNTARLG